MTTDTDDDDLTERGRYPGLSTAALVASRKQSHAIHKGLGAVAWNGGFPRTDDGFTIATLATWTVCLWLTSSKQEPSA